MIMQVEHISKSFGGRVLFSDASFRLEAHDRLALVGPNGAGKTTMLNIITGHEDADEGRIVFARGAQAGYLEQEAIEMEDRSVFEEVIASQSEILEAERRLSKLEEGLGDNPTPQQLAACGRARDLYESMGGYVLESQVRSVLFGLGFKEEDMQRSTTEFSGGWQMRIALAKLLIRKPELLLLDEPTNHLDLESVKWLEGFLRGYDGAVMVVSHDRAFSGQHGRSRRRDRCGTPDPVQGQLLRLPQAARRKHRAPEARGGKAARGNSPHAGVYRAVPL